MNSKVLVYLIQLLFPLFLFGQNQALVIAVGEYEHFDNGSSAAVADATRLGAMLSARFGFEVEIVENPSAEDIRQKLDEYRQHYEEGAWPSNGQLLLYFTGRGAEQNGAGYFLPADGDDGQPMATGLAWYNLLAEVADIKCTHILVVADALYSSRISPDWDGQSPSIEQRPLPTRLDPGSLLVRQFSKSRIMLALDPQNPWASRDSGLSTLFRAGLAWAAGQSEEASIGLVEQYLRQHSSRAIAAYSFKGDAPYATFVFYSQPPEPAEQQPGSGGGQPPAPGGEKDGFVHVSGGAFTPQAAGYANPGNHASPQEITIRDFYISPEPVTSADFVRFGLYEKNKAPDSPHWRSYTSSVTEVDWYEAVEYCNWLSRHNGLEEVYTIDKDEESESNLNRNDEKKWAVTANWGANGYRLPTAAEWEYAACGHAGKAVENSRFMVDEGISEWCWDWEGFGYSSAPEQLSDPHGPPRGAFRALRRQSDEEPCGAPGAGAPAKRYSDVGFRVVRRGGGVSE
ncbi:MAG: SUMF1/EgtB/PvdO family nonheme iron enzyme [Lewinellaceae bacterium]|nr:SUMF1/EgtB/PvdO family nonheme iron enzyme [Lewinellaceae bacterium]